MKNIEMKARCDDLARVREIARAVGATHRGVLRQIDTYFDVWEGRLKLREAESSELIFYQRADAAGPRSSEYEAVPVIEPARLRAALASALGISVTVSKTRDLWVLDNVRIHFDDVSGLGTFLELEAGVDADHSEDDCQASIRRLLGAFGVRESELIGSSYSDMLGGRASESYPR